MADITVARRRSQRSSQRRLNTLVDPAGAALARPDSSGGAATPYVSRFSNRNLMARLPPETVAVNPADYYDPRAKTHASKLLTPRRLRVQLDEIRERKRLARTGG